MNEEPADPGAANLPELIGIEGYEATEDRAAARLPVTPRILQPYGVVHGGAYAALAESVCSAATDTAVSAEGMTAMGQSIQVTFLRPIVAGHVNAEARARHRGRTTWVWDVELTDDEGRLCALAHMTIAVRPRPSR
jgi:1,4-dihydroxy-2-naphthoyl-CoA hydrolase